MLNKLSLGAVVAALLLLGCNLSGPAAQVTEVPTLTVDPGSEDAPGDLEPGETRLVQVDALNPETARYVRGVFAELGLPAPSEVLLAVDADTDHSRGSYSGCRSSSIGCGHSANCSGSRYVVHSTKTMSSIGPCTHPGCGVVLPVIHTLYGCTDSHCGYFRDYARQYHYCKAGEIQ